eukprot:11061316-Ditylum_brightwellii.AAC.2
MLDNHAIDYSKHTIVQSSNLKGKLERCNLKCNEVTIISLDIINMYHLVWVKLIQKALQYYAKDLPV